MGKRGPQRDPAVQRRIVDAATELICTHGPNQVTVNQIAHHAGVGKQTIYRWWPTKSALVIDSLEQAAESKSRFPNTGSAYNDIRTQMRRLTRVFAAPMGSMIRELVADSQGDPKMAGQFRDRFFSELRRGAEVAIDDGIERGELRDDLDVETVVDLLYGPLWLRLLIGHQPLTRNATDRILDHAWRAMVREPNTR